MITIDTSYIKLIVVWVVICIIFIIGGFYLKKIKCYKMYSEYQPQFTLLGGCKVNWNGKITPVDIIREI